MTKSKPNIIENSKRWDRNHPFRRWCIGSKHHHKKYKVNITLDELETMAKSTPYCNICGVKLDYTQGSHSGKQGKMNIYSPTLDRKNNESYLDLSNTWIICNQCNRTKGDRTWVEYIQHCKFILEKFGSEL